MIMNVYSWYKNTKGNYIKKLMIPFVLFFAYFVFFVLTILNGIFSVLGAIILTFIPFIFVVSFFSLFIGVVLQLLLGNFDFFSFNFIKTIILMFIGEGLIWLFGFIICCGYINLWKNYIDWYPLQIEKLLTSEVVE